MSVTLYALHLFSLGTGVYGAPIEPWQPPLGNKSALQREIAPSWVAAPLTRGTFEILYSCTFTLALCVYTAIHLNVPWATPPHNSELVYFRRKSKWALIALLAPEVVLYTAWKQWSDARSFRDELCGILKSRMHDNNNYEIPPSTISKIFRKLTHRFWPWVRTQYQKISSSDIDGTPTFSDGSSSKELSTNIEASDPRSSVRIFFRDPRLRIPGPLRYLAKIERQEFGGNSHYNIGRFLCGNGRLYT